MFTQTRKIILDDRFRANPYPVYSLLREQRPVCPFPSRTAAKQAWLVTRYEEIIQVLRDERFARDIHRAFAAEELEAYLQRPDINEEMVSSQHLLNKDGPDHDRIRPLLNRTFAKNAVQPLRSRLEELAHETLCPHIAVGRMELITDFALPFTVAVIGEILGIPQEIRISTRNLSDQQSVANFIAGLETIISQRLSNPQSDLTTELVEIYRAGGISYEALIDNLLLIFVAGHETTMNMIANSVLTLLHHPEEWQRLCQQPDSVVFLIDELLRHAGSVEKAWVRWATADLKIDEVQINRGDQVYVALASGNRDAAVFDQAEVFCPHRQESKNHLAFGYGAHYCAGAALGRLELEVALRTLLVHLPNLQLAVSQDDLVWLKDEVMRGLCQLPVKWSTA